MVLHGICICCNKLNLALLLFCLWQIEAQILGLLLNFPSSRFGDVCLSPSSPTRWAVISAATSGILSSSYPRLSSCSASTTAFWVCGWLVLMVWSILVDHSTRYSVTRLVTVQIEFIQLNLSKTDQITSLLSVKVLGFSTTQGRLSMMAFILNSLTW